MAENQASGDLLAEGNWQVYIIRCTDESLYTGITLDIERRIAEHGSTRGAKYFRGRQPLELVYLERGHSRASACRREVAIKKLTRTGKLRMIAAAGTPE